MGVIFGIVNLVVVAWFYASASSVHKKAIVWAVIGGLSFLAFKFAGYALIGMLQGALNQADLADLVAQGYVQSDDSTDAVSEQTYYKQSVLLGVFYEFFPLIVALLGVAYVRAKYILNMGFIESFKRSTPIKFSSAENADAPEQVGSGFKWSDITAYFGKPNKS